ncbi:unnamed protein product [Soboliphyme baturini]|uniref:Jacalin-type lectin domain-containing protein n=1 Tax=Soboliphyme baturini TaxID=241478 RepID=A0A183IS17_9BILA|nr:unnamed protein product [Soboliphyme baturini]
MTEVGDAWGKGLEVMSGSSEEVPNVSYEEKTRRDYYIDSYALFSIHWKTQKAEIRSLTYKNVVCYSRHLVGNNVVLSVGRYTGIFTGIFTGKAGANVITRQNFRK